MAGRVLDRNALTKFRWISVQNRLYAGIVAVVLGTFALDVFTPHDFVGHLFLYYFAIFMSSRLKADRAPFVITAIVSSLILLSYALSDGPPSDQDIVNRVTILAIFWAMTLLAYRRILKNREFIDLRATSESARRLRDMIVRSNLAIQILDLSGNRLFVNQALADMMGYESPNAIMKTPSMTLVAPHEREFTHTNLKNFVAFGEGVPPSFEFDGLRRDGSLIRLQVVMQAIEWEGRPAIQRTFIDISDRVEAQSALEASEKRFRDLIEGSSLGIQINNAQGKRLLVNSALASMLGYDCPAELANLKPLADIAPYEHGRIFSFQKITAPNNGLPDHYELDLLHKDGSIVPMMVYWRLLEWEGQPAVQRIFINISERKKAEAELADGERRYRALSENMRLGLLVVSRRGKLMVNKAYADLLGYESTEELMAVGRYGALAPYDLHRAPTMENIDATPPDRLPASYQIDQVRKDGTIVPVEIFSRIIDWKGERAVQNIVVDLSERKSAEAALANSERQFRELFEDLKLGLMISGRQGMSLVNNAFVELLGYESAEELMAIDRFGDIAPHDRHRALTLDKIEEASEKIPSPIEFDLLHKDGSIVPVEVYWRLFEWEGERAVQRIFVDLTERKRAEAALVESEQEYRDLIERAPIGMQIASGSGRRLWVNAAFARMLGYATTEQMLDLPGYSLIAPYHHDRLYPFSEIAKQGTVLRESDEVDLVCKDGSIRMTQVFRRQLIWQGEHAIQLAYIDLTERKRAEQALATSEEHFRDLFEKSNMGMHINDRQHNRLFVNDALVAMLGYDSAEEVMSLDNFGLVAPGSMHLTRSDEQIEASKTASPAPYELELLRKDGTTLPVQIFWRTIIWEGEEAIHRTYIDVSERKRAEEALAESEARYRDLFEHSPLGIRITDENGNRMANQAMARMSGYDSVEELLSLPRQALISPPHRNRALTNERIAAEGGDLPASVEIDLVRKDGSLLPVQVFWRRLEWQGAKAVERTYIDISERKEHELVLQERDRTVQELRQALARASQIGAMGEVASVIAHELHQPLAAIANTASAAQRRISNPNEDKTAVLNEMLPMISGQASRAGQVIGGIRKLFDGQRTERSLENINAVVAEACQFAIDEFKSDALEIEQRLADPPPFAVIDRVQIQQVIYNLLRNASDALLDSASKEIIVSIEETDNRHAQISVYNSGPSVPAQVKSKLFDAFFTTKEDGMGMGLFTCQRIVEAHEGRIWVESEENRGTTVNFTLPIVKQTVRSVDPGP